MRRPQAGYLAWLDCSDAGLPGDPATWFRQHAGIELSPGPDFGPGNSKYARLNFATTTALLDDITGRMSRSLQALLSLAGQLANPKLIPGTEAPRSAPGFGHGTVQRGGSSPHRIGMPCPRWLTAAAAVLLLSSCSSTGTDTRSATGVVTGIVYSAPSCPVERIESPCPPRPVANAEILAYQGQHQQAATHAGGDGRFRFDLRYGHYTIQATNVGGYGSTARRNVDVSAAPISVELTVDSGIR
jgi:hypothetical protein